MATTTNGITAEEPVAGLSVRSWDGAGYKPLVTFGAWCVAELNHAEKFAPENLSYQERHNRSDETFVLLAGTAYLLIGENLARVDLAPHRAYNVRAGVWHQIQTSPGARLLIVENGDADDFSETRPVGGQA